MKILVYGSGSVGTYLGTVLSQLHEVVLYGGRKINQVVGKTIQIEDTVFNLPPVIEALNSQERFDMVLVTTKMYDVQRAIRDLVNSRIQAPTFCFIQNGLVPPDFYSALDGKAIVTMTVYEGYTMKGNQIEVRHNIQGWHIDNSPEGRRMGELLRTVRIHVQQNSFMDKERAEKTLLVSAAAGLCVIEHKTPIELLRDSRISKKMFAALEEGYIALSSEYMMDDYRVVREKFVQFIEHIGHHYPSLYEDYTSGRATEIDFLNGVICDLGVKNSVPTPINQEILTSVHNMVRSRGNKLK